MRDVAADGLALEVELHVEQLALQRGHTRYYRQAIFGQRRGDKLGKAQAHESAGVVVERGGGVAEGLEQRPGGRERAPRAARAPRQHAALQAHARRLRLARAALACDHSSHLSHIISSRKRAPGPHSPVMTMHCFSLLSRTQRYADAATAYLQRNAARRETEVGGRRGGEDGHSHVRRQRVRRPCEVGAHQLRRVERQRAARVHRHQCVAYPRLQHITTSGWNLNISFFSIGSYHVIPFIYYNIPKEPTKFKHVHRTFSIDLPFATRNNCIMKCIFPKKLQMIIIRF